jgi:predicted cupin superfamily sugar epimerase
MPNLRDPATPAEAIIAALGLLPHPEGGHYRETWRDIPADGTRGAGTAILFLLRAGERSHWHRVDAAELWLWHAGAPLRLLRQPGPDLTLGPNLAAGETLQGLVPAHAWQAAEPLGAWALVSCTVSPAFRFEGFELAAPGWQPPGR